MENKKFPEDFDVIEHVYHELWHLVEEVKSLNSKITFLANHYIDTSNMSEKDQEQFKTLFDIEGIRKKEKPSFDEDE